jgi:hypothetical protein
MNDLIDGLLVGFGIKLLMDNIEENSKKRSDKIAEIYANAKGISVEEARKRLDDMAKKTRY